MNAFTKAPELRVAEWINVDHPVTIKENVRQKKITVMYAFQLLCPGCVAHALPQARNVHDLFAGTDIMVIGLHTLFEHQDAVTPLTLKAFLHENQIIFPVGIDTPSGNVSDPIPQTMRAYQMQGTPTLTLIDRQGLVRKQIFGGPVPDLRLGAELMALLRA